MPSDVELAERDERLRAIAAEHGAEMAERVARCLAIGAEYGLDGDVDEQLEECLDRDRRVSEVGLPPDEAALLILAEFAHLSGDRRGMRLVTRRAVAAGANRGDFVAMATALRFAPRPMAIARAQQGPACRPRRRRGGQRACRRGPPDDPPEPPKSSDSGLNAPEEGADEGPT